MKILGYHIIDNAITSSNGRICTEPPFLDFLLEDSNRDTLQVMFHLDWNTATLCRLIGLTKEEGRKLLDKGRLNIAPYVLNYVPKKFLSIDKGHWRGHPFAILSNMAQYADFRLSPADDPVKCAREAATVGQEVYDTLASLGLHPTSLVSPIRPFQREVLSKMDLPTVDDIPSEAGELAYSCCKGSWVECFQRGFWNMAFDYDLSSSYPAQLAQLPDLRQGKWHHSVEPPPDTQLGYCQAKVTMTAPFHPILYKADRDMSYTPTGTWPTELTLREVEFIRKHKLGKVALLDGWWWSPATDPPFGNGCHHITPLTPAILWLYSEKEKSEGLRREVIKRILAGTYGLLLQVMQYEEQEMGPLFNPVWAAEVETNTRLEVARFALDNGIVPIHTAVDGLIVDRELPVLGNGAIGEWELASCGPTLVIGSGAVALKEKRGIGDFTLDYDWLLEAMKEHPEERYFSMRKWSPVTLAKALSQERWERLGELEEVERTVDVCWESKRAYPTLGECARDVLENQMGSMPWDISIIGGLKE